MRPTQLQLGAPKSTRPITCRAIFAQLTDTKGGYFNTTNAHAVFGLSPCGVRASIRNPKTTQRHPETPHARYRDVIWTRARTSAVAVAADSTLAHRPSSFPHATPQLGFTSKSDKRSNASPSIKDRIQHLEPRGCELQAAQESPEARRQSAKGHRP
jgi:hypothetical protein